MALQMVRHNIDTPNKLGIVDTSITIAVEDIIIPDMKNSVK